MRTEGAEIRSDSLRPLNQVATRRLAELNPNRVEEILVCDFETEFAQTFSQLGSGAMNALGDHTQSVWAVINRVHGRNNREEHLGCANIAGGFVAPDVLLARLQSKAISRAAFSVMRDADKASGKMPFKLISRCHVGGMRSTKAERYPKALR